jgi:D-3-phosphoglycerate dehydrogenase
MPHEHHEHVVSMYHLNDLGPDELHRLLPGHPEVMVSQIPEEDDPLDHAGTLGDATIVLAPLDKERRITDEQLAAMPRLRLVQAVAVGFDGVDHLAAAERGIPVANLPGFNSDAVADWTVGALLSLLRRYDRGHVQAERGDWDAEPLRGRDVAGLTVGIAGFGSIGRAVARRLDAFGARVLVHDPAPSEPGREYVELEKLFAACDVVSTHMPLNDATRGLVGDGLLDLMPQGGYLLNAGRGGVVDEDALVRALDAGRLAGAALDVFATEPLPADSPLRGRDDVLLSPHAAGVTREAYQNLRARLVEQLDRVLSGEPPRAVVNGVRG